MPIRGTTQANADGAGPDGQRRNEVEAKIAAALHSMLDSGLLWSDVTVEKIATEAGIKRTLFYVYYPDRNSVLIRLGNEMIETTAKGITEGWLVDMDGPEGLRRELQAFMKNMSAYLSVARALMDGAVSDPEVRTYWSGLVTTMVDPTAQRLKAIWDKLGLEPPADPRIVSYSLCRMTEKVVTDGLRDGIGRPSEMLDAIYAIWVATFYYSYAD